MLNSNRRDRSVESRTFVEYRYQFPRLATQLKLLYLEIDAGLRFSLVLMERIGETLQKSLQQWPIDSKETPRRKSPFIAVNSGKADDHVPRLRHAPISGQTIFVTAPLS